MLLFKNIFNLWWHSPDAHTGEYAHVLGKSLANGKIIGKKKVNVLVPTTWQSNKAPRAVDTSILSLQATYRSILIKTLYSRYYQWLPVKTISLPPPRSVVDAFWGFGSHVITSHVPDACSFFHVHTIIMMISYLMSINEAVDCIHSSVLLVLTWLILCILIPGISRLFAGEGV